MKLYIPFLLLFYFAFGCSDERSREVKTVAMNTPPPPPLSATAMENVHLEDIEIKNRKLIKTGKLTFETADPEKTRKEIISSVAKINGYIAEDQERKDDEKLSHFLLARVPASRFDELEWNTLMKGGSRWKTSLKNIWAFTRG
jgi:hypothetical protein